MNRIAICGFKGSGKDRAATAISTHLGHKHIAFVDPLKEVISNTFGLRNVAEYDLFKRTEHEILGRKVHGRDIVREVGMAMLNANNDVFINYARSQMGNHKNLVISDLRFEHELEWCKANGFVIVKVTSDRTSSDGHVTEQEINDQECDIIIHNCYTSKFDKQLIQKVAAFSKEIV